MYDTDDRQGTTLDIEATGWNGGTQRSVGGEAASTQHGLYLGFDLHLPGNMDFIRPYDRGLLQGWLVEVIVESMAKDLESDVSII